MNQRITAIVEQGRLRPTVPLNLPEGMEVHLVIVPAPPVEPSQPRRNVKEAVAEIIALPTQGGDPNTSRDHDQTLNDPLLQLAGTVETDIADAGERHDHYLGQALADELHGHCDD